MTKAGSGTVRSSPAGIDCRQTYSAPFDTGTFVSLTTMPDAGYRFSGWSAARAPTAR